MCNKRQESKTNNKSDLIIKKGSRLNEYAEKMFARFDHFVYMLFNNHQINY
jgi:hypothetical protein